MDKIEVLSELKRCFNINFNRRLFYIFSNQELDVYKRLIMIELENLIDVVKLDDMQVLEICINILYILQENVLDNMSIVDQTTIFIHLEFVCEEMLEEAEVYEEYESCFNIKNFIDKFNKIRA